MQRSAILPFAVVALIAACSDSTPQLGERAGADLTAAAGNPPPPAITGYVDGDFALSADFSASVSGGAASGVSLQRSGGAPSAELSGVQNIFFHFQTGNGNEMNGTRSQTQFWLNLGGQPALPPNPCFPTSTLQPRITWDGAQIVGSGIVYAIDLTHNGIWFVDLSQLTRPSIWNPFIRLDVNTFRIEPKVTPKFCLQTGVDGNNNPIYQGYNANRVNLKFHQGTP